MATLPRMYSARQKANVTFPFSTSPRKLQEMTFADGNADLTSASGVSMKQYEEQLNSLRKENFHLKLRIYFLEEKLGSGSPPAVQGLLEHNVRLQVELEELTRQLSDKQQLLAAAAEAIDVLEQQVELEELTRQLSDKQQLLAAAAEAIDVLEQQGSISIESEGSVNGSHTLQKRMQHLEDQVAEDNKVKTSDTDTHAVQPVAETTTDGINSLPEQEELLKLKREYHRALKTIQVCMKRIHQQEKEIRKLKLETDVNDSRVSDSQVEKYEEILKCKNEHIQDLEQKLRDIQNNGLQQIDDNSAGNLQELLTKRLQGLAYFLDKLLSHKCVLGEDKKKLAESLLEQSLALPVGLRLDETMAPEDFTMDESTLDFSQSMRMEDLTMMFGHHCLADDAGKLARRTTLANHSLSRSRPERLSESECWSEPDRKVSLARMGLGDVAPGPCDSSCEEARGGGGGGGRRARPSTQSHRSGSGDAPPLQEEVRRLRARVAQLEEELLAAERRAAALGERAAEVGAALERAEGRVGECEAALSAAAASAERLRGERRELEATFAETERALRRAADEAALQASQAALERTRAHHERLRVERELDEARERLAEAARGADSPPPPPAPSPPRTDRPTSPDQGIDSDRLSSLEHADAVSLSPRTLYEENVTLKQKLARAKATLADTLTQLNAANMRKRSVQRAICREIHKTQGVLRKARDQFESQS